MTIQEAQVRNRVPFVQRYPLMTFAVGTVVLGSLATWFLAGFPPNPVILPLLAFPISYIPALLAWLVLRSSGSPDERRAFQQRLRRWRVGARWYAVASLILPSTAVVATALTALWGGRVPFHPRMFALLPLFLITNAGEEIGWRGYALPRLQARLNALTASLLLGGAWAAFHWVAFLQNSTLPWAYLTVGTFYLMAMSVVMAWLFNHASGSIPVLALTHAMYDVVSIGVMPITETNRPLLCFALGAGLACVIAVVLVIAQGVDLGKPAEQGWSDRAPA